MLRVLLAMLMLCTFGALAQDLPCTVLNAAPMDAGSTTDGGGNGPFDAGGDAGSSAPPLPSGAHYDYNPETPCAGQSDGFALSSWSSDGSITTALTQATSTQQPVCRGSDGSWAVDADGTNDYMQHAGSTAFASYTSCMVGGFDAAGSGRNSKYASGGAASTTRGAYIATNGSRQWSMFGGTTVVAVTAFEASDNSYDIVCIYRDAAGNGHLTVNGTSVTGSIGTQDLVGITLFSYYAGTGLFPSFRMKRRIIWGNVDVRQTAYNALVGIYGAPPIAF